MNRVVRSRREHKRTRLSLPEVVHACSRNNDIVRSLSPCDSGWAQPVTKSTARDFARVAKAIDHEVDAKLAATNIPVSPDCSDAEFLRRVSIDIIGRIPTSERVRSFVNDKDPNRRAKLVDELLGSAEFGRYLGSIWYDLLVKQIDHRAAPEVFENWLADQFNKNRPWDGIVRDIVTAEGRGDASPPVIAWVSHSEMAAKGKQVTIKPAEILGTFSQKFLGQRIQCAECHNHPFTGYKQDDFWSAATLVSRVSFFDADKKSLRGDRAFPGMRSDSGVKLTINIPETTRFAKAKFPDGSMLPAATKNPRVALADWLTEAKNPAFAPAMANRMWGHFLGRGFVHPVDDFRLDNPPSHPAALKLLADEFAASGFDVKHLIRCVCATRTYQRSSDALHENAADNTLFSHAAVRPMSPGVMYHSVNMALGKDGVRRTLPVKHSNKDKSEEGAFSKRFRGDDDEEPEPVDYTYGIPQALWLLNNGVLNSGPMVPFAAKLTSQEKTIEHLYLSALGRFPKPAETAKIKAFVARAQDPLKGYSQAYWAILNSSEFQFNH